jgi:hypothetical protein
MVKFFPLIETSEFTLEISNLRGGPGTGFLYLRDGADSQFIDDLVSRPEVIGGTGEESNKLRFEFGCNRSYTIEEIDTAVRECVRKFKVRRGFVHAVYEPRWRLADPGEYATDFILHVFPLTSEVKEQLEANPAVARMSVISTKEGVVHIDLRKPFERDEVRPDLEEILHTFAGKEFVPKSEKTDVS